MTGKAPAVAKRIFDTYADALAYANDVNDSAIEGLVLSVVADTEEKNGVYFVQQVAVPAVEADPEKGIEAVDAIPAVLVKLGSEDNANSGVADVDGKLTQESLDREAADQAILDTIGSIESGKTVMGVIADEVTARENAVSAETSAREAAVQSIEDTIGEVPENKTVVKMIEEAQAAAEAAATKIADKDSGHVTVSVEQDETTGALTYTISESDIASAQALSDEIDRAVAAEAELAQAIATEQARAEGKEGELAQAIAGEADARKNAIAALDAEVTSTGGTHVTVKVTEVDGVITAVNVTESDIASADVLASVKADVDAFFKDAEFAESAKDTLKELQEYISSDLEGAASMMSAITKNAQAIADEEAARKDAIAALDAEVISKDGTHVTVKVTEVDGVITAVNVTESDIASAAATTAAIEAETSARKTAMSAETAVREAKEAELAQAITDEADARKTAMSAETAVREAKEAELAQAIATETSAREDADSKLSSRLDAIEAVEVTGKDAIVVNASGATEHKEVSLKLAKQPAEGEAGVVLSQTEDGLKATLQWGTF